MIAECRDDRFVRSTKDGRLVSRVKEGLYLRKVT